MNWIKIPSHNKECRNKIHFANFCDFIDRDKNVQNARRQEGVSEVAENAIRKCERCNGASKGTVKGWCIESWHQSAMINMTGSQPIPRSSSRNFVESLNGCRDTFAWFRCALLSGFQSASAHAVMHVDERASPLSARQSLLNPLNVSRP